MNANHKPAVLAVFLTLGFVEASKAAREPYVTLGSTSFYDGFGGTGFANVSRLLDFNVERIKVQGRDLTGPGGERLGANLLTFEDEVAYTSPQNMWGWKPGGAIVVPVVLNAETRGGASSNTGLSDVVFGVDIQSTPVLNRNGQPIFQQRFALAAFAPTGGYDKHLEINIDAHVWALYPHWAASYIFGPGIATSLRVSYLLPFRNPATGYRSGQALHFNLAVGYQVKQDFTIGLTAYSFHQFTDDNLHGRTLHGRQSQVFGIGPGIHFHVFRKDFVSLNASFEAGARNMAEGARFVIEWVHGFD